MMTEAEQAQYYYEHRNDPDSWGEPEPVETSPRLTVTLSVRFTVDEIAAVREIADQLGMKPTAFIRQAAITTAEAEAGAEPSSDDGLAAILEALQACQTILRDLGYLDRRGMLRRVPKVPGGAQTSRKPQQDAEKDGGRSPAGEVGGRV